MVHGGEEDARRKARRRRSAFHPNRCHRGPLCSHPRRQRHRVPPRNHPLRDREQALPRGLRQGPHERAVRRLREVRVQRRTFLRIRRGQNGIRQDRLGLRAGSEDEGVRRRPDSPEPAQRFPAPEEARRALHARNGRADLRNTEGHVPQGLPDRDVDGRAGKGGHDHICPWMDAALDGRSDDPGRSHAAAAPR